MYHLIINHISNYGADFLSHPVLDALKDQLSKKIVIVALIALSCLTAVYLAYTCYRVKEENKEEPSNDLENQDLSRQESPEKVDDANDVFEDEKELKIESKSEVDVKPVSPEVEKPKIEPKQPDLKQKGSLEEEQRSIKLLKQQWVDDLDQELQRLKKAGTLPDSARTIIDQLIRYNQPARHLYCKHSSDHTQISVVAGRVLELKNIYRNTHYVFTHGQATEISVANQLIKELVRNFTPLLHHPLKIPFRVPHTVNYTENAEEFINKYNAKEGNSSYSDNNHNAEMISVDAYFWNIDGGESAFYYLDLVTNINISGKPDGLLKIFKTIISNYVLESDALVSMLAEKACKIANQKKTETKVGTLYAICIPKSIVQDEKRNFAYQCHPFGKQCNCFPAMDRIKLLEDLQSDRAFTCSNEFKPQYRLLTSRLTEEKDVRSFAVDALPKERRKFYRNQIKDLVAEINQYSYLSDLIEQLAEGSPVMDQIQSLIEASPQLDLDYVKRLFAAKELYYQ